MIPGEGGTSQYPPSLLDTLLQDVLTIMDCVLADLRIQITPP